MLERKTYPWFAWVPTTVCETAQPRLVYSLAQSPPELQKRNQQRKFSRRKRKKNKSVRFPAGLPRTGVTSSHILQRPDRPISLLFSFVFHLLIQPPSTTTGSALLVDIVLELLSSSVLWKKKKLRTLSKHRKPFPSRRRGEKKHACSCSLDGVELLG